MLPRYSIRTMFYLAIGVAVLAIVVGQGIQGELWALGLSLGVASLLITWLVLLLFYAMVAAYARVAIPPSERIGTRAYYPASSPAEPSSDTSEMAPSTPAPSILSPSMRDPSGPVEGPHPTKGNE